jgi:glycosyltransferase involved in cell wall biosynthesis
VESFFKKKYRFLFIGVMILGKRTAFENLREVIDSMDDVEPTWLSIELEPDEWFTRLPLIWNNHSLRIGLAARSRVYALEQAGQRFDAAFFNHILPAVLLRGFRKRVPCADSMDVTPMGLLRHGQAYYEQPRHVGFSPFRNLKTALTRSIFQQASYLFPYSEFTKQSLVEDYGLPEDNIIVLPPGTDVHRWPGRGTLRPTTNGLQVLFVGSEFKRKGGDLLVDIARQEEFRSWEFHFVTRSTVDDPPANVFVHKDINANSKELLNLYQQADVFALPTRADFGPTNSVCEAMAMGLPVISTSVGGLAEIVRDGETGYIVQADNKEVVADRLRVLAADSALRLRLGKNARSLVERSFNVEKNGRTIVDCLKRAADKRNIWKT